MTPEHQGTRKEDRSAGRAAQRAVRELLAEIVALEAGPIGPHRDTEKNVRVYRQGAHLYVGMQDAREAGTENLEDVEQRAVEADPAVLGDADSDALQAAYRMEPVEDVLRRHHPNFGDSTRGERIELLMRGAEHFDRAWRALDAFKEFCQAGSPRGHPRGKATDPEKDMRAAELRYAQGLRHREIGVRLGIPRTENDVRNNDYGTVARAINRGWALLAEELGEEGRDEHIEAQRRWHALGARERILRRSIEIASLQGRSPEEAEAMRPDVERLVDEHLSEDDQPLT